MASSSDGNAYNEFGSVPNPGNTDIPGHNKNLSADALAQVALHNLMNVESVIQKGEQMFNNSLTRVLANANQQIQDQVQAHGRNHVEQLLHAEATAADAQASADHANFQCARHERSIDGALANIADLTDRQDILDENHDELQGGLEQVDGNVQEMADEMDDLNNKVKNESSRLDDLECKQTDQEHWRMHVSQEIAVIKTMLTKQDEQIAALNDDNANLKQDNRRLYNTIQMMMDNDNIILGDGSSQPFREYALQVIHKILSLVEEQDESIANISKHNVITVNDQSVFLDDFVMSEFEKLQDELRLLITRHNRGIGWLRDELTNQVNQMALALGKQQETTDELAPQIAKIFRMHRGLAGNVNAELKKVNTLINNSPPTSSKRKKHPSPSASAYHYM